MGEETLSKREIIQLAAEAGAKAAMETRDKERLWESNERVDKRLRNTRLLLRNYRVFVDHVKNAVYDVEECESAEDILADLMMPGRDNSLFVESIKQSVARTATIVKHIETMMKLYQAYCQVEGTVEDERRWRVIYELYIRDISIGEKRITIPQLAKQEGVVDRTIYKDIDIACERITAYMFGIDGLKRK